MSTKTGDDTQAESMAEAIDAGAVDHDLAPARAILCTHNAKGEAFTLTGLKKWVRLARTIHHAAKLDLCLNGPLASALPDVVAWAFHEHMPISPRVGRNLEPEALEGLAPQLHDIVLCPTEADPAWLHRWMEASAAWEKPVRAQVHPPFTDADALAQELAGAVSVNIALSDPFMAPTRTGARLLEQAVSLAGRLHAAGVETFLLDIPYCQVDEAMWPLVCMSPQRYLDYQHYLEPSYELALDMLRVSPAWMDKAMENQLAREISVHNSIDRALFPWIINHPKVFIRTWMVHKLTRHIPGLRPKPEVLPEDQRTAEAMVAKRQRARMRKMPKPCRSCRMQRICDHGAPAFRTACPGATLRPIPGETVVSPLHFIRQRDKRYIDAIDETRRLLPERHLRLAEEARRITLREPHTREITTDSYEIDGLFTHHMPGAVRWLAFTPGEMCSTVLSRIEPPFTLAMTFGGGIAEHIGFAFGRTARVMCPMIDYTHRLTLHADAEGYYVLLRDNVLVRPAEFEGERRLPERLSGCLEPRIAVRNADGMVITQTTLLWEHGRDAQEDLRKTKYSVIIINSRYARRMQAALLALAHQEGLDFEELEVVIGYIPGIDATDDVIDSMQRAYPQLRIVRAPFSPDSVRSKGYMINEAYHVSSGDWIVLLDADILLPHDFFRRAAAVLETSHFIAPDGRKMLTPETSAKVMLGDIRPWECHEELAQASGEYRFREANRVPIGFCQCVRRDIMEKVPYQELDHFEGSDWYFGNYIRETYGAETRLEGCVVLHLDHGGSQWYGTKKQM
jgi:hypothetical protein